MRIQKPYKYQLRNMTAIVIAGPFLTYFNSETLGEALETPPKRGKTHNTHSYVAGVHCTGVRNPGFVALQLLAKLLFCPEE